MLLVGTLCLGDRGQIATDSAVVTSMYGDVQVRHGTAGYTAAKLNEVLKSGDAIKTGADSRAELGIGNGGYVRMDESSQLLLTHIQSGGTTSFQALMGGIWVTLENALTGNSRFEVNMPSAVASVKGTVFRCEVGEDGASETFVYEGEVDVTAGDEFIRVKPNESARVVRNLKLAMQRMDLAGDDEKPWVTYNRHRDIIRHLGNPSVMVALSERGIEARRSAYLGSAALATELKRHGIVGASVTSADEASFSIGADGLVKWRKHPTEDYCIVGVVSIEQVRELKPGVFAARVAGKAILVEGGERNAISTVDSLLPGVGETEAAAVADALKRLGKRLGEELAPRLIKDLMAQRGGALRIDVSGGTREQIGHMRQIIGAMDGVIRTAPLRLPGDRFSLVVAGGLEAGALAREIQQRGGDMLEAVRVYDRVIYVRFKQIDGEAQARPQGNRPTLGNRPRVQRGGR
jgi:hypothetical protein